jgi:3-hydroxybutyrate dehydrogenase
MAAVHDRVALVTGGSRGIGRGIAVALLAEGAKVVINGRSAEKGQRALEEMGAGDRGHFIAGDVRRREDCEALVDGTVERYGRIDILINNAGGGGNTALVAEMALTGFAHYVTTKHAINGFTKAVAQETGPHGITCNAICPGVVLTDIWEENGPGAAAALDMSYDAYVDMIVAGSALKRPNTVEEIAAMAVLLCSEAGAGISGACLSVDGGSAPY